MLICFRSLFPEGLCEGLWEENYNLIFQGVESSQAAFGLS